jgi:Ni/Co efflux regulator RcnB
MCQKMGLIQAPSAPLLSPVDLRSEHRASCDAQGKHNKQTRLRKKDRKKEIERERERENQREGKKDFMEKKTVHAIGPSGPGLANNGPTMFTSGGLLLIHS